MEAEAASAWAEEVEEEPFPDAQLRFAPAYHKFKSALRQSHTGAFILHNFI